MTEDAAPGYLRSSASALLIADGRARFVEQRLIASSAINAVGHQAMLSCQAYIEALPR